MRLTLPQQDIYFEQLLHPYDPIYNIGAKIEIVGTIDFEILNEAYKELINQHDSYRSRVSVKNESIKIKIIENLKTNLNYIDLSNIENSEVEANSYIQKAFIKPFNLHENENLFSFTLIKVTNDLHYLFSVYHHIITDGWGTSLMFQRLVANYNEILNYGSVQTEYPYTYNDFVIDDLQYYNSEEYNEDKQYWANRFNKLPEALFEKFDENCKTNKSDRKELIIKRELYNKLEQLAKTINSSTFHVILGLIFTYFARKNQNHDLAIGVPVLNRSKSSFKKTVGLFMGISPLRINLDIEKTFEEIIVEIKNQLRIDYRHQRFPLGKLVQELGLLYEKERLFNITLSYEKQNYSTNFHDTMTTVIPLSHKSERVALAIYIREFDVAEDVKIDFDYNLNYFTDNTISQVINHIFNLINEITSKKNIKVKNLNFLSEIEKNQLLFDFNNFKKEISNQKTTIELFLEQVNKNPDKIAVKDNLKELSYNELNQLSDKISHYLSSFNLKNENSPIVIIMDRSSEMIAFLIAILKIRQPYIPLDPNFPISRLNYILNNSEAKLVIADNENLPINIKEDVIVLKKSSILEKVKDLLPRTIIKPPLLEDTAYIIYTSGSTGNPKGVEIGHLSLANFLLSIKNKPHISADDLLYSVTTYSFDISILEFFAPLISGATVFIADQSVLSDPKLIIENINSINPTIIQATPSFFRMLYSSGWEGNKKLKVMCGGDVLDESLTQKLIDDNAEVWNMYGPTETTIWSSLKKIVSSKDYNNIGKPINNTAFYILDSNFQLLPIDSAGNIYIGGIGLAKGYYKNEALTIEKFIQNPFEKGLIYESGDVGKWNKNGEIIFFGRNDNQVKIRGYRIELGDIEFHLSKYPGVIEAIVISKKDSNGDSILIAFIKSDNKNIDNKDILKNLSGVLPKYMLPNLIIKIDRFPLTPNLKVDRKSLSEIDIDKYTDKISTNEDSRIFTETEKRIHDLWVKSLGNNPKIGLNDNFFTIGGHSLNAVKLCGLISKEFLVELTFKDIYENPTLSALSSCVEKKNKGFSDAIPKCSLREKYLVTPSQFNIWVASQQKSLSTAHNMIAAFTIIGEINYKALENTINFIIKKNEILRTNFVESNDCVYQKINPFIDSLFKLNIFKLNKYEVESAIQSHINSEFDLENDFLLKISIFELENENPILLFAAHHIILDGLSLEILVKEIILNYNSILNEDNPEDNPNNHQFKDYSEWVNSKLKGNYSYHNSFWENYLADFKFNPSFHRDSESNNKYDGKKYYLELPENETTNLKKNVSDNSLTLGVTLISALNILINKYTLNKDICLGIVHSGRNNPQLENLIGLFVKTYILRTKINLNDDFIDLSKIIFSDLLKFESFGDIPSNISSKPFFDVLFAYQNSDFSFSSITANENLTLINRPIYNTQNKFPIIFNLLENENKITGFIEYNSNIYNSETIELISKMYIEILKKISNGLFEIDLLIDDDLNDDSKINIDFNF